MKSNIMLVGIALAAAVIILAFYLPIASIIVAFIGLIGAGVYWLSMKNNQS